MQILKQVQKTGDRLSVAGNEFELHDSARLTAWIRREASAWQWLFVVPPLIDPEAIAPYIRLQRLANTLTAVLGEEGEASVVRPEWVSKLEVIFDDERLVLSSTPKGKRVLAALGKNPELAAHLLAYFLGRLTAFDSQVAVEAAVAGSLFDHGVRGNVDAERNALQRLRDEWRNIIDDARSQHEASPARFEVLASQIDAEFSRYRQHATEASELLNSELQKLQRGREQLGTILGEKIAEYRDQADGIAERLLSQGADAERELHQLVATYNEHMALKAPVSYWEENRETHRSSAKTYLKSLAVTAPIGLAGLLLLGWFLVGRDKDPHPGRMILFFAVAGMIVWGLRILVRLYLSHVHLETDARERIVMAKTYLALRSEGVDAQDRERSIVMETLFRPAATGIINDDAAPVSAVELVSRLMRGEK